MIRRELVIDGKACTHETCLVCDRCGARSAYVPVSGSMEDCSKWDVASINKDGWSYWLAGNVMRHACPGCTSAASTKGDGSVLVMY